MAELWERLEHRALLLQLLPERHHQPHQRRHRVLGVRPQLPTPGFSPSLWSLCLPTRAVPVGSAPWAALAEGHYSHGGHGVHCADARQMDLKANSLSTSLHLPLSHHNDPQFPLEICGFSHLSAPGSSPSSHLWEL